MNGWGAEPGVDLCATAFPTDDSSIFTLEGIDFGALLQYPRAEIEVSMGTQQTQFGDETAQFQQFASLFGSSPSTYTNDSRVHSGLPSGLVSQQSSHPSYGAEYQQYFNLDGNSSPGELDTQVTPPRDTSEAGSTPSSKVPSPASYVPPPGALQAGTRRVAASWKRPEPDSPVSPTWPYSVSART